MKHAAYFGTRNIYDDMETAAKSLVANSDVGRVHFFIEDPEFPRPLPDIVECHDVSGQGFFDQDGPNTKSRWTYMVLLRVALCHLLPDVDVALSLDCDTVCVGDVSDIWDTPVGGRYFAAVRENRRSGDGLLYTNFGVVLFNLEKLRDGKADEIIGVLNSRRYTWPEQDVGNYLCQGRIGKMPPEYNATTFMDRGGAEPRIVHYAAIGRSAWHKEPEAVRYMKMGWDEAMRLHEGACSREKRVLFISNHDLDRDEALRAVWDAYDGPKKLVVGVDNLPYLTGYPVVVCDTIVPYVKDKDFAIVNIGHGVTGGKLYALDEQRCGIDARALAQTDYAISTSTETVGIVAGQFGIPDERVLPLGMPRTDGYIGRKKGDGGTFMAKFGRAYLYAPTFRGPNDGERLPDIDWAALDGMLDDDEVLVVKRHYFTRRAIAPGRHVHIVEVGPDGPSAGYLTDCDVLLTDYSSILFDAYLLGKPAVLTVDDAAAYMRTRGMYYEFPDGYCSRNIVAGGHEAELLDMLREAAENGMGEVERACIERSADMCDGHGAERVCELIRSLL